ncbi:MAG: AmmeMemoRadiSam system protein B [Acidobacteriota bacterium]|nr:AmmeMemoRadiSam system protein B [Acidobacteriota bacterium]
MVREAAVAGQFYPAEPEALRAAIEAYVQKPSSLLDAKGVVVPHAGYIYSGKVAGEVFSSVRLPDRMILLGPNHTGRGAALALAPAAEWDMPFGPACIDEALNRELLAGCPELKEDAAAHRFEHSLEVQIPFLQALQPDFRFCAICIRTIDLDVLESLGHAMARVIRARKKPVLLIASSDMSHYESSDSAARQDQFAIDQMLAVDPPGLHSVVLEKRISMCGFAPAVAVLTACRDLGALQGKLIRYTNSGEASGEYDRVVAYAGIAIS